MKSVDKLIDDIITMSARPHITNEYFSFTASDNMIEFIKALDSTGFIFSKKPHISITDDGAYLEVVDGNKRCVLEFDIDPGYGYAIYNGTWYIPGKFNVVDNEQIPEDLINCGCFVEQEDSILKFYNVAEAFRISSFIGIVLMSLMVFLQGVLAIHFNYAAGNVMVSLSGLALFITMYMGFELIVLHLKCKL